MDVRKYHAAKSVPENDAISKEWKQHSQLHNSMTML